MVMHFIVAARVTWAAVAAVGLLSACGHDYPVADYNLIDQESPLSDCSILTLSGAGGAPRDLEPGETKIYRISNRGTATMSFRLCPRSIPARDYFVGPGQTVEAIYKEPGPTSLSAPRCTEPKLQQCIPLR